MKFIKTHINDVHIIEPEPHEDSRGMLRRHFCRREFRENGLMTDIKQCNVSENNNKHTLRGFHYQLPPSGDSKVITCFKGHIYDIVVDLRRSSSTYLEWQAFEVNSDNRLSIYVPSGCANAFLTVVDDTWVFYYHSEYYVPNSEAGIRYNDPYFDFKWPVNPDVISDKDLNIPDFSPV